MASNWMPFLIALLFATLSTLNADQIVFLDPSYLKTKTPKTLSGEAYETLLHAATGNAVSFEVSQEVSKEVDQFLLWDIIDRPVASWEILLFGNIEFQNTKKTNKNTVAVDLTSDRPIGLREVMIHETNADCHGRCLLESFEKAVSEMGDTFEFDDSRNGIVYFPKCSSNGGKLPLDTEATIVWASELGRAWKILQDALTTSERPIQIHTLLSGLFYLRLEYGADSEELKFGKCFTQAIVNEIHTTMKTYFNGKIFMSIHVHDQGSVFFDEKIFEKGNSRQLLQEGATNETTSAPAAMSMTTDVQRFSTHAAAYVIFLFILFASLGSVYAMSNMDFSKDTLLYSQAKID